MISARIGVYGSLDRARAVGLSVCEHYAEPSEAVAERDRGEGIDFVPVIWVPESSDPSEGVVNIYGSRGLFAFNNSGCISNPSVRRRLLEKVRFVATKLEAKKVILDALRFPSPHDGELFFSCFCRHCSAAMRELGVDPEELRKKLASLRSSLATYPHVDPSVVDALSTWVKVRQMLVAEVLQIVRDEAKRYGMELWMAVFPPSLSWLVGQNYSVLRIYAEEIHVMCYHRCSGAACLNHELSSLSRILSSEGLEHIERALRVLTGLTVPRPAMLESQGLGKKVIIEEFAYAKRLLGDKAVAVLQLDDEGLGIGMDLRSERKLAFLS